MHLYTYIRAFMHACMNAYTHTYIHTYILVSCCLAAENSKDTYRMGGGDRGCAMHYISLYVLTRLLFISFEILTQSYLFRQ